MSCDTTQFVLESDDSLTAALRHAVAVRYIGGWENASGTDTTESQIELYVSRLVALRGDASLTDEDGNATLLGEVLDLSLLGLTETPGVISDLVEKYFGQRMPVEDMWEALSDTYGPPVVERIQFSLRASALGSRHFPFVQALWNRRNALPTEQRPLALEYFAGQSLSYWADVVDEVGLPAVFPGRDEAEAKSNYALSVYRMLEQLYPTRATLERLASEQGTGTVDAAVVRDFAASYEGFDLAATDVHQLDLLPEHQDPALLAQVELVGRVYALVPPHERAENVAHLLNAGVATSFDISTRSRGQFINQLTEASVEPAVAQAIYDRAQSVSAAVTAIAAEFQRSTAPRNRRLLGERGLSSDAQLASFLEGESQCQCAHCRSVLGPAAYFYDLLGFVGDLESSGTNAGEILRSRRPDIFEIELNCTNSHRPLPAIDLSNELLEYRLVRSEDASTIPGKRQTTWDEKRLQEHPEHLRAEAYESLATKRKSSRWALPFDLAWHELRRYLSISGADLETILAANMSPRGAGGEVHESLAVAQATLGLSASEIELLTDGDSTDFWGDDVDLSELTSGMTLRALTGLSVAETMQVFESNYVCRPGGLVHIMYRKRVGDAWRPGDACHFEHLHYSIFSGGERPTSPGVARFRRFNQFVRLQRALGWTYQELDFALEALDIATPSSPSLTIAQLLDLAALVRLARRFPAVPRIQLFGWLGRIEWRDKRDFSSLATIGNSNWGESLPQSDDDGVPTRYSRYTQILEQSIGNQSVDAYRLQKETPPDWKPDPQSVAAELLTEENVRILAAIAELSVDEVHRLAVEYRRFSQPLVEGTGSPLDTVPFEESEPYRYPRSLWPETVRTDVNFVGWINAAASFARTLQISIEELIELQRISNQWFIGRLRSARVHNLTQFADWVEMILDVDVSIADLGYQFRGVLEDAPEQRWPFADASRALVALGSELRKIARDTRLAAYGRGTYGELMQRALSILSVQRGIDHPTLLVAQQLLAHRHPGPVEASMVDDAITALFARFFDADTPVTVEGGSSIGTLRDFLADESISPSDPSVEVWCGVLIDRILPALFETAVRGEEVEELRSDLAILRGEKQAALTVVESIFTEVYLEHQSRLVVDLLHHRLDPGESELSAVVDAVLETLVLPLIESTDALREFALRTDVTEVEREAMAESLLKDLLVGWGRLRGEHTLVTMLAAELQLPEASVAVLLREMYVPKGIHVYSPSILLMQAEWYADLSPGEVELLLSDETLRSARFRRFESGRELASTELQCLNCLHRAAKMSQSLDLDAVTLAWLHKKYADSSGRAPRYLRHRLLSPAQLVTETNLEHEHVLGPIAPKYFEAWRRTRALRILSGSDEQTRQSWRDYLDQVPQSGSVLIDPLFAIPEYMKTLARLLGCTEQAVAVLYSARAIPESAMSNAEELLAFARASESLERLSGSVLALQEWIQIDDADGLIRPSFERAHAVKSWAEGVAHVEHRGAALIAVRDALREAQRDALSAALFDKNSLGLERDPDVVALLLNDVFTNSCADLSRIKEATLAVQMFVQRIFLGLESGMKLPADERDEKLRQWRWRGQYRVWEANRKVFLYPENWMLPELRDDKSEAFERFEDLLASQEITAEHAEKSYLAFLRDVEEVGNLQICGLHRETVESEQSAPGEHFLHVFGRTRSKPYSLFYRRARSRGSSLHGAERYHFEPWTSVPFQIDASDVLPFVQDGQLHLVWPHFTEGRNAVEPSSGDELAEAAATSQPVLRVGLRHAKMSDGIWSAPALSEETLTCLASKTPYAKTLYPSDVVLWWDRKIHGSERFRTQQSIVKVWFLPEGLRREINPMLQFAGEFHLSPDGTSFHRQSSRFNEKKQMVRDPFDSDFKDLDKDYYPAPPGSRMLGQAHRIAYATLEIVGTDSDFDCDSEYRSVPAPRKPDDKLVKDDTGTPDEGETSNGDPNLEWVTKDCFNLRLMHFHSGWPYGSREAPSMGFEIFEPFRKGRGAVTVLPLHQEFGRPDEPLVYQDERASFLVHPFMSSAFSTPSPDLSASYVPPVRADALWVRESSGRAIARAKVEPWSYMVQPLYHPFISAMVGYVVQNGVDELLSPRKSTKTKLYQQELSVSLTGEGEYYGHSNFIWQFGESGELREDFDFTNGSAFGSYNWEMFFHAPMLIAEKLRAEGRFRDALDWLHYLFDPRKTHVDTVRDFWLCKPLAAAAENSESLDDVLAELESDSPDIELLHAVDAWIKDPFKPYLVARARSRSFIYSVYRSYLQVLLDWADERFRQFTLESLQEATLLYLYASEVLGPRPEILPELQSASLSAEQLTRRLSGADSDIPISDGVYGMANLESRAKLGRWKTQSLIQPSSRALANEASGSSELRIANRLGSPLIRSAGLDIAESIWQGVHPETGKTYFCLPSNPEVVEFWDRVDDRLHKLRNCLNIDGLRGRPPLFEAPLDPGALVQGAANGDFESALTELRAPRPYYRFVQQLALAKDFANELRSTGGLVQQAHEKRDAEALARIRQEQDGELLDLGTRVFESRIGEYELALSAMDASIETTKARQLYYRSRPPMIRDEKRQADMIVVQGVLSELSAGAHALASVFAAVPDFLVGWSGSGPHATTQSGGRALSGVANATGAVIGGHASTAGLVAQRSGTQGSYKRRQDDWDFQAEQAEKDLVRLGEERRAAQVRLDTAKRELDRHRKQVEQSRSVLDFMRSKFTNQELYAWMLRESKILHSRMYDLALEQARRAERCFNYELARGVDASVRADAWNGSYDGLLAGERLIQELKRLEQRYYVENQREYELVKRISVARLDPYALAQLRATGRCYFHVPELLFDVDHPGQYFRRIRSASLSLPCVTGPFTSVGARLTLQRSAMRREARGDADLVPDQVRQLESISTSTGQEDAGVFDTNGSDGRYLPFEGRGVDTVWELVLPEKYRQFDYGSIEDVVLTIRYTAREGGDAMRQSVESKLVDAWKELDRDAGRDPILGAESGAMKGQLRALSLRRDFPDAWAQLLHPADPSATERTAKIRVSPSLIAGHRGPGDVALESGHGSLVVVIARGSAALVSGELKLGAATANLGAGIALGSNKDVEILAVESSSPALGLKDSGRDYAEWTVTLRLDSVDDAAKLQDLALILKYSQGKAVADA